MEKLRRNVSTRGAVQAGPRAFHSSIAAAEVAANFRTDLRNARKGLKRPVAIVAAAVMVPLAGVMALHAAGTAPDVSHQVNVVTAGEDADVRVPSGSHSGWREAPAIPLLPIPKASNAPPSERNDAETITLRVLAWERDRAGVAVLARAQLKNNNPFAIENPKIDCSHTLTASGEIIGHYSKIIDQIIGPQSSLGLHDVSTGFVVREGTRVVCRIDAFAKY